MKKMTRKTKKQASKFENRVRFNWGYHDAAFAVKHGLDNAAKNFGFGPAFGTMESVRDVLAKHHDPIYAQGWQQGLMDAQDGTYANDSEAAWNRCLAAGTVTDDLVACPDCNGGSVYKAEECEMCDGAGKVSDAQMGWKS